jgi:hypothetical protein
MRERIVRIAFAGVVAATVPAAAAFAQTSVTKPTVKAATGQLGASINNAGLQQSFDLSASRALTTSKKPWLADAHVALGGSIAATPAGVRGGGWVEVAPVSVYSIRAGAEPGQYFGTFHSLTSFDARDEAFGPDARKARGGAASGRTTKLYVSQTFQLRAGHVVARATFNQERWSSNAAGPLYYEPTRDTLLAVGRDHISSMNSVLLYQKTFAGGGQLMFGPMHSIMRVNGENSLNRVQKAGLVAMHQMPGKHLGLLRPSISVQAAYYIDDPNKQGQWGGAMAIGFSLGKPRR